MAAMSWDMRMPYKGTRPEPTAWPIIAAIMLLAAFWMAGAGLSFDWPSALVPALACMSLEGLAAFYRSRRPDAALAAVLTGTAQLIGFTAAAAPLSYAVASTGGRLWDATLLSWDQELGLNWRAYLAFVDARPTLGVVFTIAYQSIKVQLLAIVLVLGFSGHIRALREFVLAVVIAGTVTILISALMPAMAMFVHLGLQPKDFPHLDPAAAFVHVAALTGLRDGTFRMISLSNMEGIITFPSFHAALGVIFIHALWRVGWVRLPGVALNLLLIAATPIDGGHYFVDVLGGGAIAIMAVWVARLYRRRAPSRIDPFSEAPGAASPQGSH